ncbi:MAG TPA: ATP-binding protein, partial [Chitinophagaceae bacterium]|nr:ATP-binding protein [Chitinophagaceae bacterium]
MRSTTDLDRITPLVWKELTTLGISFIRCGVFIMDEKENKVQTYLSTPDGQAIAAFHTPMDDSGSLVGAIEHWRQQKIFVTHWVDSDFQIQADILLKQGSITTREQYLNTLPKEGFHLHFLPFRQGMLYVGSNEQLPDDALQLVQSLADAFSVAYARYEDFTRLELAKQQIEKTLTDLKQTQTQLIQSEKMASLGELTAGIAHEIQNPLNFVNNFSEVNSELIDEIKLAIQAGNAAEVLNLADDIKQNLEKVSHHGKRADAIVKGMLAHSRSSSGEKVPTDINALADEYLRLSYHGLRAKDNKFNADFKTNFDPDLPKVHVIPQDIGRVLLNLINNAFQAVNGYGDKPTVTVTTRKTENGVQISVSDNGPGIPDSNKEKIFQPFFTTKPTGQGTGLGLSLSYDIVKAHGGELKVETATAKEGEGSAFIVILNI